MLWSPYTALHSTGINAAELPLAAHPTPASQQGTLTAKATLQVPGLLLPLHAQADICIQCKAKNRYQNHNAATCFPELQVIQGAQSSHYKVSPRRGSEAGTMACYQPTAVPRMWEKTQQHPQVTLTSLHSVSFALGSAISMRSSPMRGTHVSVVWL